MKNKFFNMLSLLTQQRSFSSSRGFFESEIPRHTSLVGNLLANSRMASWDSLVVAYLNSSKIILLSQQGKHILQINKHVEDCINKCSNPEAGKKFYEAEKGIIKAVYHFGILLLQLYLVSAQRSINYGNWLNTGAHYLNTRLKYRTLKTFFGKVAYGRYYMEHKTGGNGLFPLDKELGLSRDGFSPVVIKLVTNLSIRMSFNTAHELFKRFCHWSPSTEAIQRLVLGLGREAHDYMDAPPMAVMKEMAKPRQQQQMKELI